MRGCAARAGRLPVSVTTRSAVRADDPVLPAIPTALPEVDVVDQWRDGVAGAVGVVDSESGLSAVADSFAVDIAMVKALGETASVGDVRALPLPGERPGWAFGVGTGRP